MLGIKQSLYDKKVLITGAGSGIGALTAKALAAKGAVLYLADINDAAVGAVAKRCKQIADEHGFPVRVYDSRCDVTSQDSVIRMVGKAVGCMGGLDIVFANAGIGKPVALEGDVDVADWILDVNFRGVRYTVDACLPHIRVSKGQILVNASMGAIVLLALMAPGYGASKAAVAAFGQGVNLHLMNTGASCTTVFMAEHNTPMEEEFNHPAVQALFEDNPRLAKAHLKRSPYKAVRVIVRAMETRQLFVHAPRYTRLARYFPAVPNWFVRTYLIQNPQRALAILREQSAAKQPTYKYTNR